MDYQTGGLVPNAAFRILKPLASIKFQVGLTDSDQNEK